MTMPHGRVKARHSDVQTHEANAEQARRAYLEDHGWKETCATPGSYWLWVRDFSDIAEDYGVMTVPMDLAVSMTSATLDDAEDGDDE